jgi:putative addiction module component (TIGR02574 family)
MSDLAKKFLEEALLLPVGDRAELVEYLLQSLNSPTQKEIDDLWASEAERRIVEYDRGKIESFDGELVIKEIRERFKR